MTTTTLLTEAEVAERLRCSCEKIKRLRLSGKLSYLPGRPVLVDEKDLNAFLESIKVPASAPSEATATKAERSSVEEATLRARRTWLARRMRQG